MTTSDPRTSATNLITQAIVHLGEALEELDRMPPHDPARIGLVAHAMNNYVSVIEATLDLLDGALRDHPDKEVDTWLAGLRHLGGLIQHSAGRLLHTSNPTEFPLEFEYVDLPRLMERACEYYRPSATRKQLDIICRSIGDVPPAWTDRVAVAVVADNLLSNAVKFSTPGGEILVQILPGPGGVVCSVRDHGPGLTPLEQARLFQPGARANGTSTARDRPSGFGLAIAKEFVDRMGGRLWSDSEPGQGACFSFRLPYHAGGRYVPS